MSIAYLDESEKNNIIDRVVENLMSLKDSYGARLGAVASGKHKDKSWMLTHGDIDPHLIAIEVLDGIIND